MTGKVALEGLEFHAYHGVYPHERSSGNKFEVDIVVDTEFSDSAFQDDLSGTVNYETLYAIVKDEMAKPSKLLETVGHAIAQQTLKTFLDARAVEVSISKFNPPIGGVCKKATVTVNEVR
jgi:dihydroneopterin aldolase